MKSFGREEWLASGLVVAAASVTAAVWSTHVSIVARLAVLPFIVFLAVGVAAPRVAVAMAVAAGAGIAFVAWHVGLEAAQEARCARDGSVCDGSNVGLALLSSALPVAIGLVGLWWGSRLGAWLRRGRLNRVAPSPPA